MLWSGPAARTPEQRNTPMTGSRRPLLAAGKRRHRRLPAAPSATTQVGPQGKKKKESPDAQHLHRRTFSLEEDEAGPRRVREQGSASPAPAVSGRGARAV